MAFQQFMAQTFFGNTVEQYAYTLAIFLGTMFVMWLVKTVILARLKVLAKKTETMFDDAIIDSLGMITWPFYILVSLTLAIGYISVNLVLDKIMLFLMLFLIVYYGNRVVKILIVHGARALRKNEDEEEDADETFAEVVAILIQITIWVGAILFVLSNLGFDITTAIAGLGIGGIAIAFALQNVLSDIFASFSIYFDKPFKVGDYIVIGADSGVVQKIGIKSTRIKTLQGQELVMSNKELTSTRINNFKKLDRRRVVFSLGMTYDTPLEKLKQIPQLIKEIYETVENADLDRVHFKSYGDFSLNYEIVYFVNAPDYMAYVEIENEINLKIKEIFENNKIEFAFPTQTIHMEK